MSSHRPISRTQQSRPLAAAAVLMVIVVLLALALRPDAAARLSLEPANLTSFSVSDRCTQTVSATSGPETEGRTGTVMLTGLGTACGGRDVDLTVFGRDGAALASGATTLAADTSGSATVTVPAYAPADVAGVALTIGTWGVPAIWTYTPSVDAPLVSCTVLNDPTGTKTCEATDVRVDAWGHPVLDTYNFYATVTSPSDLEDVEWQLTINLADPELKVAANLGDSNNGVTLAPGWSCASMPMLELRGQEDVNTKYVGGGKTVQVWMQGKAASGPSTGGNLFNCS